MAMELPPSGGPGPSCVELGSVQPSNLPPNLLRNMESGPITLDVPQKMVSPLLLSSHRPPPIGCQPCDMDVRPQPKYCLCWYVDKTYQTVP